VKCAKPALCLAIARFSAPIPYFSSFPVGFLQRHRNLANLPNGEVESANHKKSDE
jgi:hypothetical protein